jgi:hypothetical protein
MSRVVDGHIAARHGGPSRILKKVFRRLSTTTGQRSGATARFALRSAFFSILLVPPRLARSMKGHRHRSRLTRMQSRQKPLLLHGRQQPCNLSAANAAQVWPLPHRGSCRELLCGWRNGYFRPRTRCENGVNSVISRCAPRARDQHRGCPGPGRFSSRRRALPRRDQ